MVSLVRTAAALTFLPSVSMGTAASALVSVGTPGSILVSMGTAIPGIIAPSTTRPHFCESSFIKTGLSCFLSSIELGTSFEEVDINSGPLRLSPPTGASSLISDTIGMVTEIYLTTGPIRTTGFSLTFFFSSSILA